MAVMQKYRLTDTRQVLDCGTVVYQIKRLSDGRLGGWIESERNLSHDGQCWVGGDARVYENAYVHENGEVYGNARVYGNAQVYGSVYVGGNAKVYENANVYGHARVYGHAQVYGNAKVYGNARVYGDAKVRGNAEVTKCFFIQQSKHDITLTDSLIFIGCEAYTYADWMERGHAIGQAKGYSEKDVTNTLELLTVFHNTLTD